MNRDIYTYTDFEDLQRASYWQEISNYPQITVSVDLRKRMDKIMSRRYQPGNRYIYDFRRLSDMLIPNWTDHETKFNEIIILSQYIRERIYALADIRKMLFLVSLGSGVNNTFLVFYKLIYEGGLANTSATVYHGKFKVPTLISRI